MGLVLPLLVCICFVFFYLSYLSFNVFSFFVDLLSLSLTNHVLSATQYMSLFTHKQNQKKNHNKSRLSINLNYPNKTIFSIFIVNQCANCSLWSYLQLILCCHRWYSVQSTQNQDFVLCGCKDRKTWRCNRCSF